MPKILFTLILITVIIITLNLTGTILARGSMVEIPDKIRVVIAEDKKELNLSIRGRYKITTIETGEIIEEGKTFFDVKINPAQHGIVFGKNYFKIYAIEITPENEPSIYLGKRLYRGSLQIIRTKEGLLRAINVLDLKNYLKGVLYHEVSNRWPIEAIKAQAIASRTFALYQAKENKDNYYYLKSDVSSQVYGGVYAEKYRTSKAIEDTEGEALLYKGKILPAFFHATCGGRTEDSSELWKVKLNPLKGVKGGFCENSPHYLWKSDIKLSDITDKLKGAGYKLSKIISIDIKGRNASGRVKELQINGEGFKTVITAKDLRHILGGRLIKSTNFTIEIKNQAAYFTGKGWGHGVGMCQWGAFAMAKKGKKAEDILKHYYPGAKIVKLNNLKQ